MAEMTEIMKLSGNYRVEISGWGRDAGFFVEKTDLYWGHGGDKKVSLHHNVPEGAILFVRLLSPETVSGALPLAYRVAEVQVMDCNGLCEMSLLQLHPGKKVSLSVEPASYCQEDSGRKGTCEPKENSAQMETEEILQ
jgi:hypothetical protein